MKITKKFRLMNKQMKLHENSARTKYLTLGNFYLALQFNSQRKFQWVEAHQLALQNVLLSFEDVTRKQQYGVSKNTRVKYGASHSKRHLGSNFASLFLKNMEKKCTKTTRASHHGSDVRLFSAIFVLATI